MKTAQLFFLAPQASFDHLGPGKPLGVLSNGDRPLGIYVDREEGDYVYGGVASEWSLYFRDRIRIRRDAVYKA